jgi:hypothetical protein
MDFYYRVVLSIPNDRLMDQVVYVSRKSEVEANAYIEHRPNITHWEPITKEQLPKEMKFEPTHFETEVWESTTGFTPLPSRPTDPRDPTALRNP